MALLADLVAVADAPTGVARAAILWSWRSRWPSRSTRWSTSCEPIVERLFPISETIKDGAGPADGDVPSLGTAIARVRPVAGRLRGAGVPRLHPLRPGAAAPDALGHPAVGPAVRLPARADEPVPAALQRDAPGDRPGPAGRPEPEHPAGDPLPLPEQRDGGVDGATGSRARRLPPIAGWIYRNPRDGLYHGVWVAAGVVLSCGLLFTLWKRDRGRSGWPVEPRVHGPSTRRVRSTR